MVCGVWSVECGVWSVECGVWSVECGVWSVECEVWSVECGVWSVECGVWSVECSRERATRPTNEAKVQAKIKSAIFSNVHRKPKRVIWAASRLDNDRKCRLSKTYQYEPAASILHRIGRPAAPVASYRSSSTTSASF